MKHKNWRRHWEFPHDFPSSEVQLAYLKPSVDSSEEPFSWSEPSFKALKDFALRNLNWNGREIDQYLTQVKKRRQEAVNKKKGTLD